MHPLLWRSRFRSWWKQERIALTNARWRATLLVSAGLALVVTGLEAARRLDSAQRQALVEQRQDLELLQWLVGNSELTSLDWAHWDDTLAFTRGRNPDFPRADIGTSALLRDGAVMAIFGDQGQSLVLAGGSDADRLGGSGLRRCLAGSERRRRRDRQRQLGVLCAGSQHQLYVGSIQAVSDNTGTAASNASLAYLVPLRSQPAPSPLTQTLKRLGPQLLLQADPGAEQESSQPLRPALWAGEAQPVRVRPPSLGAFYQRELLALAALIGTTGLLLAAVRMQWMLSQRHQCLQQRRGERAYNGRIRRSERQLRGLLDQIQRSGHDDVSGVFARMLKRRIPGQGEQAESSTREERLVRRLEQVLHTARSLVLLDGLTGLPNRSFFLEQLGWEIEQSHREQVPLALLFLNIDKFRQINETYGHNSGDKVLQSVTAELQKNIHTEDFLARTGGDEFSLILDTGHLPDRSEQAILDYAQRQAEHLLESIHGTTAEAPHGFRLSLSIGIALSDLNNSSADDLIRRSDLAMAIAKSDKGQRISIFDISQEGESEGDYRLFNALHWDVSHAQDRFQILFQPIVDSQGKACKLEALTRWHNPDFPHVPPDVFFNVAERYRLMPELGQMVIEKTLREFSHLRQTTAFGELGLALNISPTQLSQRNLGSWLVNTLEHHSLQANLITAEITESAVLELGPDVTANLASLRQAGVRLALDDFGTGFSSLRLLMWLRPDELKIDKSFVIATSQDPFALQIVRLLQSLAQQMQLTLVAEGVEDESLLERLLQTGISRFQGYLFAKPQPSSVLAAEGLHPGLPHPPQPQQTPTPTAEPA